MSCVDGFVLAVPTANKAMADPRLQPDRNPMPFDGQRLIYGGFEMIVDL